MNYKPATAPLHDNLRDLIGQAISDEIAACAEQPDWCDSREIDRLADAVMAILPERRATLSLELRAALDEAAKTGATVAEVPGGGLVFIDRGEQLDGELDLNCPACGGNGHADDARDARAVPAGADDVFAAFCEREGYPSDGESDVVLRAAFDEGLRFSATQPPAETARVDAKPFMYAVIEQGGAPYMDEFCVATNAEDLHSTLNGLNDSPDAGYKIVPVYIAAQPACAPADATQADPEQTARSKWTVKQWYEHVGAWENPQGEVCFGSVMTLGAMLKLMAKARHTAQPAAAGEDVLDAARGKSMVEVSAGAPAQLGELAARPRTPAEAACWCDSCRPITLDDSRMVLSPTCGNKRCPRATNHRNACSGSNEPGQPGSSYPAWPTPKGGA